LVPVFAASFRRHSPDEINQFLRIIGMHECLYTVLWVWGWLLGGIALQWFATTGLDVVCRRLARQWQSRSCAFGTELESL
jgi:hypothetical protein